jgi:hypothetical protein
MNIFHMAYNHTHHQIHKIVYDKQNQNKFDNVVLDKGNQN